MLLYAGGRRCSNMLWIQKPEPSNLSTLTGAESFFSSDEFLIPAIADDPLLRACAMPFSTKFRWFDTIQKLSRTIGPTLMMKTPLTQLAKSKHWKRN